MVINLISNAGMGKTTILNRTVHDIVTAGKSCLFIVNGEPDFPSFNSEISIIKTQCNSITELAKVICVASFDYHYDVIIVDSLRPLFSTSGALSKGGINRTALESLTILSDLSTLIGSDIITSINPTEDDHNFLTTFEFLKGASDVVIQIARESDLKKVYSIREEVTYDSL